MSLQNAKVRLKFIDSVKARAKVSLPLDSAPRVKWKLWLDVPRYGDGAGLFVLKWVH